MQPGRAFPWSALAKEVAVSTGSDEEFDGFMRGRWPAMVRLGYALTGDAGHAEDLAQAAFARAYASWGRVRRAGDPDAYVRRIVINEHRNRFRKRRVAEELRGDLTDAAAGGPPGGPEPGEQQALLDALRALGPRQRAVVVLRYWLDLSEAETAAALNCSVGTVKSQASRALATLRKNAAAGSAADDRAGPRARGADIVEGGLR
jgi:RNA polymerase sigma-70 factor (sigma-E family)